MRRMRWLALAGVGAVLVGGLATMGGDDYEVDLVMPSAAQLSERSSVWINGHDAGKITALDVKNGKAIVTVSVDEDFAPLHDGSTTRVEWVSAVGERVLTIYPGPTKNAALPEGALVEGASRQVEVDQVLQALDEPTRKRLTTLIGQLNDTAGGREDETRDTIRGASAAVGALGEVLQAVGQDGPAIRALVTQLSELTGAAASRKDGIANTVQQLNEISEATAREEKELNETLGRLPRVLQTAQGTLRKVPGATEPTVDLLEDLRPSTQLLPSVSANLAPTLVDLRPTVAELRPLLSDADELLAQTPGLLDTSHQVVPALNNFVDDVGPAIAFLRPYTPEGVGGVGNWGQAFAPYDGAGHTWAGLLGPGTNLVNESPVPLPTARQNPAPPPGQPEGQPWTDANGSEIK